MAESLFNFDEIESTGAVESNDMFNFNELEPVDVKSQPLAEMPDRTGMEWEFSSNAELENKLQKRKFEVEQTRKAMESGDIGFIQGEAQILGKGGAGALFDIAGQVIGDAGKNLFGALPDDMQDDIKLKAASDDMQDDIKLKAASAWDSLSNSEFGNVIDYYVNEGSEYVGGLEKSHPQNYKTLESLVNLGVMFAPAKAKSNLPPVKSSKFVSKLKSKARRFEKAARQKYTDDFVKPLSTKAVRTEEAKRTVAGTFVDKPQLSGHQQLMSKEVLRHPNINSGNSLQKNLNNAIDANKKLGDKLRKDIKATGMPITENSSASISARVNKLIQEDPMFVGDTGKAAAKRVGQANLIISKHPKTAEGMLNARQEFDALVRSQKGQKGFTDMGKWP